MALNEPLPRRMSVDPNDPRFDPEWHRFLPLTVWLDGIPQAAVMTYDIDEGLIVRLALTDGIMALNEAGDDVATETVRGVVAVTTGRVSLDGRP